MIIFPLLDDIRRISDGGGLFLSDGLHNQSLNLEDNTNNNHSPSNIVQDVDQSLFPPSVLNNNRFRPTPRFLVETTTLRPVSRQKIFLL